MSDFNPKVSIIIPVYNGANYLREAIDSALAQTYQNCEVLVINDGSTDNGATRDIALSYGDRIRYFEKENGGVATALNLGIHEMKGEYFSWLSHDDVYYTEKIKTQIDYLDQKDNKIIVLYSDYDLIDAQSNYLRTVRNRRFNPDEFCFALVLTLPLHGCDALVPKECFDQIGLFDESLRTTNDYNMWFRLAEKYEFHHIAKSLVKGRKHREQGSITISKLQLVEIDMLRKWMLDKLPLSRIVSFSKGHSGQFYIDCAQHFILNRLYPSTKYAVAKSFDHIYHERIGNIFNHHLKLAFVCLLYIVQMLRERVFEIKSGSSKDRA